MLTLKCTTSKCYIFLWSFFLSLTVLNAVDQFGETVPDFNWKKISIICTNLATSVQCDTMDINAMNFGGYSDTHRNIISVDIDGFFALGFQQIVPGEFYLSIYPFYPSTKSAGPAVWTANRNYPIDESGTLGFLSTGTLELRDSKGTVMWCTRTQNRGVERFLFSPETGKIQVLNAANQSIWSSFDEPSDTLMENQMMRYMGGAVVSSETPDGRSTGRYSMVVEAGGLVLYTRTRNDTHFEAYRVYGFSGKHNLESVLETCRYPTSASFLLPRSPYVAVLQQSNSSLPVQEKDLNPELCTKGSTNESEQERGIFEWHKLNSSGIAREDDNDKKVLKLEHNGTLSIYGWRRRTRNSAVVKLVDLFRSDDPCSFPDRCGSHGICTTDPQLGYTCSCPLGSSWEEVWTGDPSARCRLLEDTTTCTNQMSDDRFRLVTVPNVDYFANEFATPLIISENACRRQCLENCSCVAAFYRSLEGQCFIASQPLHSFRSADSNFRAFMKVRSRNIVYAPTFPLILGSIGAACTLTLALMALCFWRAKQRKCYAGKFHSLDEDLFLHSLSGLPPRLTLRVLEKATRGFKDKLGEGGFGAVYSGILPDGTKVAVKRLEGPGQGAKEFRAEVATIGSIHHKNLVQLCGFCVEGTERLLVYEHMANGSLDSLLFSDKSASIDGSHGKGDGYLAWTTRMSVAKDTARGLAYLHEGCREKIIHLDIKPQNILLDEHFQAKVADFGLSTWVKRDKQSLVVTQMRGTPGYLAPEWLHVSAVTEKADVYSYGMLLLEMVSGRRLVEPEKVYLPAWAFQMFRSGQVEDMIDQRIADSVNKDEAKLMIGVAFACIHENPLERPKMGLVLQMLEGHVPVPQQPRFRQLERILSMSTICLSDSSSTSSTLDETCLEIDDSNHIGHSFNGLGQRATDRGKSYLLEGGVSTAYIHSVTSAR